MLPLGTFKGRVAVVTGGGSGLGEAIAHELARLDATVALLGRTQAKLDAVATDIRSKGGTAQGYPVDVRDRDRVEAVMSEIIVEHGAIDHLVNNAAGNFRVAPEAMSPNAFDAVVRIVLYGSWNCTQVVGLHMIERGRGGSILNIGANMASQGGPDTAHAASAKAGVRTLAKSLGAAWGPHNIRVNVLTPGTTEDTGAIGALFPAPGSLEQMLETVPLGRLANREEVAQAAAYLLSDYASYITGAELIMDGGRSLGRL